MDYEYVALVDQPRHGLYWDELVAEGWCEWMKIPFWTRPDRCGPRPNYVYIMRNYVYIMRRPKKGDLMVVQEIESTDLGMILEKVKSAKALGLPFTLTAEIETIETYTLAKHAYRNLLYRLCVEAAPQGAVSLTVGGNWLVKE